MDGSDTQSDHEIINYLEKSQQLFRLGNEINSKIDSFRTQIDNLQSQFKSEIESLAQSNQTLLDKFKTPKRIEPLVSGMDFEETQSPLSPSIVQKKPQIDLDNNETNEQTPMPEVVQTVDKTSEDEAFEKLKAMMLEFEMENNNTSSVVKSRQNSSSLVDCKVQVERLNTEEIEIKLSKEAEKILQMSAKKSELLSEERKINQICSLNFDQILNPKKSATPPKDSSLASKKKTRSNKSDLDSEPESLESGDEEESEVFKNENSNDLNSNEARITESENYVITEDESDASSNSDSDTEKAKSKKSNVKKNSDQENKAKSSSVIEPSLRLNLKDSDDEIDCDRNDEETTDLPVIDCDNETGDKTLVQNANSDSDDEVIEKIPKRRSKRLTSNTSDDSSEKVKSSDSEDEIPNKSTYLKGIFDSNDEDKENKEETLSVKKRKRVRLKNSDSENSNQSSSTFKKKIKKIKKELDYSDSVNSNASNDSNDSDDSDIQSIHSDDESPNKDKTRHKLRNIIGDAKLTKETQDAIQAERERKKRIEEKRALETSITESQTEDLYLDVDAESKKLKVKVDPAIARNLKPHQIEGIKFMWDSCYENCEMIEKGEKGSGCILAHCMGLGKTFQLIALIHTLITNKNVTKCHRVLILLPVNVLTNWKKEFNKWTRSCKNRIAIYHLPNEKGASKDLTRARLRELENWFKVGGVLLMGYTMFARIISGQGIKPKKLQEDFDKFLLDPGPDLVVCDEGHMLKSAATSINKSVSRIATARRIVLTGTPLQNNLAEYHCMVSFVKPNLLGTIKEFKNRFVNPINNGQHRDSTEADVRYMKKRAHILHNLLDGCVQRKDYNVIRNLLPPKKEYVLSIRLSEKQIDLYKAYISQRGISNLNHLNIKGGMLFSDYQNLFRVWTHPWVLKLKEVQILRAEEKLAEKNFIADDDEEEEAENNIILDDGNDIIELDADKKKRKSEINGGGVNTDLEKKTPERWWTNLISESDELDYNLSGKLVLLDKILKSCAQVGDKLLLFSQSLLSLDLIEKFLEKLTLDKKDRWRKDVDYFRMDGSTEIQKRQVHVDSFNNEDNHRARLFLISTKAGGIGINLVGANRCIIFDASWNPSYDTQSIFRIYRFGQKKDVFVYRFLAQGTMEEKIYQRQVTKQSLSQRVIDEHQIDRHFTSQEIKELYNFDPDVWDGSDKITYDIPDDNLLKSLLVDCKQWITKYHEHDSLLENKLNEGLSEEERKAAWEEYENEKRTIHTFANFDPNPGNPVGDDFLNFINELRANERMANRTDLFNAQMQENQRLQMLRQNELIRQQDSRIIEQINQMKKIQSKEQLENLQRLQQFQSMNLNIRVPAAQRPELDSRANINSQYLAGILGAPRLPTQDIFMQQGIQNRNAASLMNQHRKQIQQQTYSPQQPAKSTPQRNQN